MIGWAACAVPPDDAPGADTDPPLDEIEQGLSTQTGSLNIASTNNGGVASASSGTAAQKLGINNANRRQYLWSDDGPAFPDWVRVTFSGSQTIDEIGVISAKDDVTAANNWTRRPSRPPRRRSACGG